MTPSTRGKRVQQTINALLIVTILGLAGWLSTRYKFDLDWTYGNRNTLTEASKKMLAGMPAPIKLLVFESKDATRDTGDIDDISSRYQREKKDFTVEYIDPNVDPVRVKEYNVTRKGERVIEYQGRHETLTEQTEPAVTGALQRLAVGGDHYVLFLDGHGERGFKASVGQTQNDMTIFGDALTGKGLKLLPLNLLNTPKVPENASVLVVASPTQTLLPTETKLIADFVEAGGNLLWLNDPESPAELPEVSALLGITWQTGVVIFPDYAKIGAQSPLVYYSATYPSNEVLQAFKDITAFPLAHSIGYKVDNIAQVNGWTPIPLVQTNNKSWLEAGKVEPGMTPDPATNDIPGPLTIALGMKRLRKDAEGKDYTQRVALIGDADFLSDANVSQLGNKQFGINVVQWLASRDTQLNVEVPKAPDVILRLRPWVYTALGFTFVIALPLLLLLTGVLRWVLRRRK